MLQKGNISLLYLVIIVFGLGVGVFFIERGTGFLSNAWDVIGPSKSGTIRIPVKSPLPSQIATGSAVPATSSAKPKATATASASVKPSSTASGSAKPLATPMGSIPIPQ